MQQVKIGIIGVGNLGASIADGLFKNGFSSLDIQLSDSRKDIPQKLGWDNVRITSDNREIVRNAHVIIIAVKPFKMDDVLREIASEITAEHMIMSTVSGYSLDQMEQHIGKEAALFRIMPNTAISAAESVTCISSRRASEKQVATAETIFGKLGEVISIKEELMNAATVLGACGIAYGMRFLRAMTQGGIEIGFDAPTANKIAIQTLKGACELLIQNGSHPEQEIDKVTTPKGCTIAGLNEMEHQGFSSALIKGILTSFEKI